MPLLTEVLKSTPLSLVWLHHLTFWGIENLCGRLKCKPPKVDDIYFAVVQHSGKKADKQKIWLPLSALKKMSETHITSGFFTLVTRRVLITPSYKNTFTFHLRCPHIPFIGKLNIALFCSIMRVNQFEGRIGNNETLWFAFPQLTSPVFKILPDNKDYFLWNSDYNTLMQFVDEFCFSAFLSSLRKLRVKGNFFTDRSGNLVFQVTPKNQLRLSIIYGEQKVVVRDGRGSEITFTSLPELALFLRNYSALF